jgi:hypothetical protein
MHTTAARARQPLRARDVMRCDDGFEGVMRDAVGSHDAALMMMHARAGGVPRVQCGQPIRLPVPRSAGRTPVFCLPQVLRASRRADRWRTHSVLMSALGRAPGCERALLCCQDAATRVLREAATHTTTPRAPRTLCPGSRLDVCVVGSRCRHERATARDGAGGGRCNVRQYDAVTA